MDCVADQLVHGTRFRALTVVDIFTKECLAIEVGQNLKGEHVDRGQLWGQQIVAESPGYSVYAGFRAECEGRRPTNSTLPLIRKAFQRQGWGSTSGFFAAERPVVIPNGVDAGASAAAESPALRACSRLGAAQAPWHRLGHRPTS
jgi:hypothetical protein